MGAEVSFTKQLSGSLVGRRMAEIRSAGGPRARAMAVPGAPAARVEPAGRLAKANRVDALIRAALGDRFGADPGLRLGDSEFYLPTVDEVTQILVASQLDRRTWLEERYDCDDFAYCLKGEMSAHAYDAGALRFGLCVGIVWANFSWVEGFHAVNWFIASDEQLRLIEPQTDEIYAASECRGDISLLLV